jgi:hypothetical protein
MARGKNRVFYDVVTARRIFVITKSNAGSNFARFRIVESSSRTLNNNIAIGIGRFKEGLGERFTLGVAVLADKHAVASDQQMTAIYARFSLLHWQVRGGFRSIREESSKLVAGPIVMCMSFYYRHLSHGRTFGQNHD